MLGVKGPKQSMLDKASQHFHIDLRVMTSQVQRLTKVIGMTVAA